MTSALANRSSCSAGHVRFASSKVAVPVMSLVTALLTLVGTAVNTYSAIAGPPQPEPKWSSM